jgi:hypothetical protein
MKYLPLIFSIVLILLVMRMWRRSSRRNLLAPEPLKQIDATPDKPVSFGRKMSWLAVRATDPRDVVRSLRIHKVQPANWRTGFIAAYSGHTFVSPSIDGWVFVLSHSLPSLGHEPDAGKWVSLMNSLSMQHGEAQYFATHRVSGFAAWSCYESGREQRAFAYCDGTLVDRGPPARGEIELNHQFFDSNSAESRIEGYWDRTDLCLPSEDHVLEVAGKWSINPQSLDAREAPLGCGAIGQMR